MITKLILENFRSIRRAELPLGKITVLTGANNSGKSSIIYGLLALRNFVRNPNQPVDSILNLPDLNLGGFDGVIYRGNIEGSIIISIICTTEDYLSTYQFCLNKAGFSIYIDGIKPINFRGSIASQLPYSLKGVSFVANNDFRMEWNGFSGGKLKYLRAKKEPPLASVQINGQLNLPLKSLQETDFIPLRRGFSTPFFGQVPLNGQYTTEAEIATLISIENPLAEAISYHLEKIAGRKLAVEITPRTANFYLKTTNTTTGQTLDIVNEGHGTNQLVTILAKALQPNAKFICIDEPEIHLHPTMIGRLVDSFIEIAQTGGKQFLVSTHSEHFVQALMTAVADGRLAPDDAQVHFLKKDRAETEIESQPINEHGQIKGGLKNFWAGELENLKTLFNLAD